MQLWSVYDRPPDHPRHCAVRKILVEDDGLTPGEWSLFTSLDEARSVLQRRGLIRVPRDVHDDPALVETWV